MTMESLNEKTTTSQNNNKLNRKKKHCRKTTDKSPLPPSTKPLNEAVSYVNPVAMITPLKETPVNECVACSLSSA